MQKMWGDVHDLRNDGEAVRRIQRHRNPHLTRDDVVDLQHAQRHTRSMAALTSKKLTDMWAHLSVNARKPKCPHCGSTAGTRHPIGAHEKSHESQCMSCGELAPFSDFYEGVQKPSNKKKRQLPGKGKQVAVDLDGTLAVHDDTIPFDPNHIGEPVEEMLQVVKQYALDGYEPVLFTARASDPANIPPIEAWLKKHGIPIEKITNQKTPEMAVFLDDRARGVEMNTGVLKCATEETGQPYTPIKPGLPNWGSVRPSDFLRASPEKTSIRKSVDQRSWVSPEPDMAALSTPFDAPSLSGPVRRSEAEIATLRAGVKPEYRNLYNERESDKTKPADTYIGTITPGFYKQKVYGDAWTSEIAKAHQYNKQNNLPGDMNLWAKPVPVTKFPGGMDHFKPSPRSIELSANESFDLGTDPNADFNLTKEEAAKFKSPLIMQHEATHAGQIDNDVSNFDQKALEAAQDAVRPPFYDDGTFFKTTPVPGLLLPWGVKGSAHDVYAPEMRAYLSALQEHMFKTRGKRIESPEEFDQVMQEIKPDNTLHPDVSRYIRQMQKVKEGRPDIHEILHNWGRRVIPGIVSNEANTPDTVKTAFEQSEYAEALKATNDEPTDAQKECGNYKKGRFTWHNIDIAIENPKGSIRRGKSKDGTEWQTVMKNTYGYITSTPGSEADDDKVDVFVGNHPDTQLVGVVDQYAGERFDEHKCILGVTDAKDAEETYLANYEEGWDGCGDVTLLTADQFKQWLLNGDTSRPLKGQKFDEFMKKVAAEKFVRPENFESVDDLGKVPNNYKLYVGANDWESCGYTWAALFPEWVSGDLIYDGFNPVRWIHIDHSDCPDCKGDCNRGHKSDYAKQKVREWLAGIELSRLERMYGRKPIESVSKDLGNEGFDITEKTANVAITTPQQPVIPTTGLAAIVYRLKNLDMQALRKKAQDDLATGKKTRRAPAVKLLNIIEGLDRNELKPSDLLLSKIPVLPPIMRPYAVAGDTLIPGDENELYRDMMQALRQRKELSKTFGDEHAHSATKTVYDSAKALMGYGDPVNAETRARGVTGFAQRILGSGPKQSWLISKMIAKPVDAVGRSVISVNPDLNIDQIGLPREMAWKQYQPVLIRHLVKSGMPQMEAIRAVRNRTAIAERAMERIIPENPVIYSRAPAWHKHSVLSGFVKLVDGDAIQVNPYVTTGLGADFDGDTVNVHVPISDDAVDEARNKLLPSKMVLKTRDPESAMPQLKHEQIMGLGSAQVAPAKKRHVFANEAEAIAAVRSGKISMSDEVEWPDPIPVTPVPVGSV